MEYKWRVEAAKAYRDGVGLSKIAKTLWHKQSKVDWVAYGLKNQRELKGYLKEVLDTWETE